MLSILNPPRIKRVCLPRRSTRSIVGYAGRFLSASSLVMPLTIWFVRTLPGRCPYLIEQVSPAATSVSPFSGISIAYGFRNSSWDRSLTVRIRAFSCRRADPPRW